MRRKADLKRTVLQGIYEENAGIPRSYRGKRRTAAAAAPAPEPAPPRPRTRLYALAGLSLLVVLAGLALRDGIRPDPVPVVSATTAEGSAPSETEELSQEPPNTLEPASAPRASDPPPLPRPVNVATSGHYDDMLDDLPIPVADLFDLKVQTIVIDPGHGGRDPGAIGHQGLMEKDVVLDIARRLRDRLEATGGYRVVLTRDDDSKMLLKDRVAFANEHEADLFISIHINSVPEQAGQVNYVETYYFGPHSDQRTLDLARKENQNSEYAMGDFRDIIARIGDTLKTEESAQLAASIHRRLYTNLRRHGTGLLDAGAKSGPFVVLLGVEVPSVLVEVSCISNKEEAERLASPAYRESVASYLQMGIVEYLEGRHANRSGPGNGSSNGIATGNGNTNGSRNGNGVSSTYVAK